MNIPIAIAFRGLESSAELRADVNERVQRLDALIDDILACRVSIASAAHWLSPESRYDVQVRVAMPCIEIEASSGPESAARDPHAILAETFDVLTSRIEDFVRRRCNACVRYAGTNG
jgi:hypothetical protein